jgi:superkiller protein 3
VPYFPPKHHSRATRLLNGVLTSDPSNSAARFARAQVFQYAGNWNEARKTFQKIIDTPESQEGSAWKEEAQRRVAAREEVGWCLVNEGSLEGGREVLEAIVQERDGKWEEDGKKDGEDAIVRARAWWRLGRAEWLIGGKYC